LEKPGIPRNRCAAGKPGLSPASQPDLFWKYDIPHTQARKAASNGALK
jgi:hypothetical protein